MSVFLPIKFDPVQNPLFANMANQMSPLAAKTGQGFSLNDLSTMIYQQLGTDAVLGDHAIPSIGAYVEYMTRTVLSTMPNPHYLKAWRGVLAMVALGKLYNFNIRIEERNLPGDTIFTAKTPLNVVYKQELRRLGLLDGDKYYIILRDEYPLAILHRQTLLCPFKSIDPRALANVPWVSGFTEKGEPEWKEIQPCAAPGAQEQPGNPTQTEKFMLCAWLLAQAEVAGKQGGNAVAAALNVWRSSLANGQPVLKLSNYTARTLPGCAAASGMKFGALDVDTFATVPDFKIPIEVQQLTDKLLFTNENISSLAGANGWDLRIAAGAPGGNTVVPPITADFAQLLSEYRKRADSDGGGKPDLELADVRILYDKFSASGEVTVQITVRNDMLNMVQTKTYKGQDIIYVNNFPYVCMWPYTYLAPSEWKDYYVDMVPVLNPAPKPVGLCQEIDAARGNLTFAVPGNMIHNIQSRDRQGFTYQVLQSEQFPWFVPLAYTDALGQQHQGGCLLARPDGKMILPGSAAQALAAIDFGTSNSVCAVKCGAQTFYNVLDGKLMRALVKVKANSTGEAVVETFHRYYGISNSTKDGKFASVAELYSANNNQPYIDGQILLTESGIIDYFTAQDTNLQAIGIFSNLKRDTTIPDVNVNHAIELFVMQLTLLCALVAKQQGCSSIEYCFSYPNEAYRRILQGVWNTAISQMDNRRIFISIDSNCITEYNASAQYVQNFGGLLSVAIPQAGFAVVDIGGGTSDMTVWQNPTSDIQAPVQKLGSLSFQYAGNQIFSHSFFTYFKKNPAQLSTVLPQIFGYKNLNDQVLPAAASAEDKAKALRDAKAKKAIRNYINAISEVSSVDDEAKFPALTALLNTLLEEPGIDTVFWNSPSCDDLRMMVSFKLKGILFVLANLIWECNGINTNAGTYRIFLVGGGSQAFALPAAANASMFQQTTKELLTALTAIDPSANSNPFQITQPKIAKPKTEVVNGALVCMQKTSLNSLLHTTNTPPAATAAPAAQAVNTDTQILFRKLETLYRAYVEFSVKRDPSLNSLLPKLELPSGDGQTTPAQQAVSTSFTGGALTVWGQVDQNLDKNISERTRLSAFAVRMAEELLNQ